MTLPPIVSRAEWLRARQELLAQEKELTRARARVNAERRRLPMVLVDKPYTFEGPDGTASLLDLFEGRPQLVMHHFMWINDIDADGTEHPRDAGCSSCSSAADGIGHLRQLHVRNTTLVAVSRAPWAKIAAFRERMGWTFPWYSSAGSDFNYDFHATVDDRVAPVQIFHRSAAEMTEAGMPWTEDLRGDWPGISAFLQVDGEVYHTYSTFGRGIEEFHNGYPYLDLTALGRQEAWEEPKGRATALGLQVGGPNMRLPDEYLPEGIGVPGMRANEAGPLMVSDHDGMRILVTGHRGNVGVPVAAHLARLGHEVVGFDRVEGADLLDLAEVRRAAAGCAAIVHLGALAHDTAGSPEQIMAVNVLGTWHVLLAAEAAGVTRVIHFSSAQVFGTAEGERLPDYLPVDDAHPRRAMRAYGLSKCLAEDMCAGFTARTGIASVSLRPVWVWDPGQYQRIARQWRDDPASEREPYWEYGAFVDVRDVATAVAQAVTVPLAGHHRALLCAADIAATEPSLDLAARLAGDVPVTDPARYQADPWRALMDCSVAETTLGWRPRYRWAQVPQ